MSGVIGQKTFASLSSGLLARKGQARPAMRPQGFPPFGSVSEAIDDLGWNDMGHGERAAPPAPVAQTAPVVPVLPETPVAPVAEVPDVIRQREVLKGEFEAPVAAPGLTPARAVKPARTKASKASALDKVPEVAGRKAAFTLRLDADRHLRLRLASALANRSAQQLVTLALDTYLHALPEVEEMAAQIAARGTSHRVEGE